MLLIFYIFALVNLFIYSFSPNDNTVKSVIMRRFIREYHFEGRYDENFADGCIKSHRGTYYVTELKTRYLVTFKPFGYSFPLFVDFCILKKQNQDIMVVLDYINNNWC